MGPLYCIALIALCGIGVTVDSSIPERLCINKQHTLIKQRLTIQKLLTKQRQAAQWLETTCHITLPEFPGSGNLISTPSPLPSSRIPGKPTYYPTNNPDVFPTKPPDGVYPPPIVNPPPTPPPENRPPTRPPFQPYPTSSPGGLYPTGPGGLSTPPGPSVTLYPPAPWNTTYPPGPGGTLYPPPSVRPPPVGPPYPPIVVPTTYPPAPWNTTYPPGPGGTLYPPPSVRPPPVGPPYPPGPGGTLYPPPSVRPPPVGPPFPPAIWNTSYPPGPPYPPIGPPYPPYQGGPILYPPYGAGQIPGGFSQTVIITKEWSYPSLIEIERVALMTTVELIRKFNYPVETHYVTTTDSYILTLHRIPRPGAQPIVLVHGLMSSSACWVQMGPSNGLAFLLYEQGFDVWMVNTRGNIYSKTHKEPNIKASAYWSFSFHEIGIYDLPNSIDQILTITKQQQVQYIGHSQGSTAFFVMCSELPQYNNKVVLMQALSPTVYMKNSLSPVLRYLSLFRGEFSVLLNILGGFEISRDNTLINQFRTHICSGSEVTSKICAIFDFVLAGFGWSQFNATLTPLVAGHASQGASTVQIYHYAQLINGLNFRRYDKGYLLNHIDYKHYDPPSYNLSQTHCKIGLHYSEEDWLSHGDDIKQLQLSLPNVLAVRKVSGFSHYDYLLSKNVRQSLYTDVISQSLRYRYVASYRWWYEVEQYIT